MPKRDAMLIVRRPRDGRRVESLAADLRDREGIWSVLVPYWAADLLGGDLLIVSHDAARIEADAILEHARAAGLDARLLD